MSGKGGPEWSPDNGVRLVGDPSKAVFECGGVISPRIAAEVRVGKDVDDHPATTTLSGELGEGSQHVVQTLVVLSRSQSPEVVGADSDVGVAPASHIQPNWVGTQMFRFPAGPVVSQSFSAEVSSTE